MTQPTRIRVSADTAYDVVIGEQVWGELPALLGDRVRRVAVIHPPALASAATSLLADLAGHGLAAQCVEVPDGEAAKTVAAAASCWAALGQAGFTRADALVTIGGGATTDLGGFVAATWLRGVRVVHVPTSLLAMVDAAVGGKTAINTVEGKNLVGAFHEPAGVLCDLTALTSLPPVELVSGLAEVVKCGFIADPRILDLVEGDPAGATQPGSATLRELVERAVRVKVDVVSEDLRETGGTFGHPGRETLNYGHTFGHAVERVENYRFRHGEAVAIGMVYVAEMARLTGRLDDATTDRHRSVLELIGLPTSYRGGLWGRLYEAMRVDKKTRGDQLRFVVLDGLGKPAILQAPDPDLLTAAYARVAEP